MNSSNQSLYLSQSPLVLSRNNQSLWSLSFMWLCVSAPVSSGHPDLLVSQTVNEGVEHQDDQGVEDRDHLALLHGLHSSWLGIHDKKGPIKEGHSCHVGATGGEELVSPSS